MSETKEVLKNDRDMSKNIEANLKDLPWVKSETI